MFQLWFSQQLERLHINGGKPFLPVFGLFVALWVALSPGQPIYAQTVDVFYVTGVHVDMVAESAAAARKKALADGERQAFARLFKRLTIRQDKRLSAGLTGPEIAALIRDFQVANEKNSSIRYLADLTYKFKPNEVRELLRDLSVEFAETRSKPILLLPVYEAAGAIALWEEANPWRKALTQIDLTDGLVPMILPRGDLKDLRAIGGGGLAIRGDTQRLAAIATNYDVSTVLVAHAAFTTTNQGVSGLKITATEYGPSERNQTLATMILAGKDETIAAMLARAAADIAGMIEDQWKKDNLIQFEQGAVIAAALPINGLSDWVEAQRRLQKVAIVERVDLVLLSRNEARINVYYLGDPQQLKLALEQVDLKLKEEEGAWSLGLNQKAQRRK
ncbi:MAG: DUF2066 domain-containing protein [Rhodospirillales bacterium]|nr:DUF2066 domain-containing protein [Rhodospirillales bacterium]